MTTVASTDRLMGPSTVPRADPDAQDRREESPWLATGVTGSVPMLHVLLPAGPDLKLRNRFGAIALIPASERGHAACVRELLRVTDIDVDHVNRLGRTALLEAVILGDGGRAHQEARRVRQRHHRRRSHGREAAVRGERGRPPAGDRGPPSRYRANRAFHA